MILEGLSNVCAKLDPASSKDNVTLEINVLQNYTSHALFWYITLVHYKTLILRKLNKNKQCHMILEGLSNVCAKLDPASSKDNVTLEINVLQNYTSHALFWYITLVHYKTLILRKLKCSIIF